MELPTRKQPRLKEYDYSTPGAYFVTVCTRHRNCLFGPVGADSISAPTLSEIIQSFKRYSTVEYIKLVKAGLLAPFDGKVWQRSYYDHIIRDEEDLRRVREYIASNPHRWETDEFYTEP